MTARAAAACWLVAGVLYPSLEAVAAHAVPGYRYGHDFISDLGRPTSPLSPLMNTAFAAQGTLFLAGAVLAVRAAGGRRARVFVACAAANFVGNAVVASVPSGSAGIAGLHVAGAVLAIVGGNVAAVAGTRIIEGVGAQRYYHAASYGIAGLGLVAFALLAVASTAAIEVAVPAAVWERTSVYTIIGWQLLSALQLLRRPRH